MSRVSLIEQLYAKKHTKSALEFDYDALWAPPIMSIMSPQDINELYRIATSLKLNGQIERKYELIDAVMERRGFKRTHRGTNRVVYKFLEMPTFVAKVAVDKVGMRDTPAEFKNQEFFKPFCCKIFEVDPSGVIGFVERVNPITSLEEFMSVSDDIFNMMLTKIIGKYVVDDLGTEKFMNYGLRQCANGYMFGPVIIDFPYAYELDGRKLICQRVLETPLGNTICGGEIDYDDGLNHLICTKCGKRYKAMDLSKPNNGGMLLAYSDLKGDPIMIRGRIIADGKIIKDSGFNSGKILTEKDLRNLPRMPDDSGKPIIIGGHKRLYKHYNKNEFKKYCYSQLQQKIYEDMMAKGMFDEPVSTYTKRVMGSNSIISKSHEAKQLPVTSNGSHYTRRILARPTKPDVLAPKDTEDFLKYAKHLETPQDIPVEAAEVVVVEEMAIKDPEPEIETIAALTEDPMVVEETTEPEPIPTTEDSLDPAVEMTEVTIVTADDTNNEESDINVVDGESTEPIDSTKYEFVIFLGKPCLYSDDRINSSDLPDGIYKYEFRGSDNDPGAIATLEPNVIVNFCGTILSKEQLMVVGSNKDFIIITEEDYPDFISGFELTIHEYLDMDPIDLTKVGIITDPPGSLLAVADHGQDFTDYESTTDENSVVDETTTINNGKAEDSVVITETIDFYEDPSNNFGNDMEDY